MNLGNQRRRRFRGVIGAWEAVDVRAFICGGASWAAGLKSGMVGS